MKPEAVLRTISYHEAGHAVVARLLGVNTSATIDQENQEAVAPTSSAAYIAREGDTSAQVAGYETDGKIALAGPIAQLMSRPTRDNHVAKSVQLHNEDFANAKKAAVCIAALLTGESLPQPGQITLRGAVLNSDEDTLERLKRETKAILKEHWPAVKRVAKALLAERHLDQAEIDRLIRP